MRFASMTHGMMTGATNGRDRLGRRLASRGRRMAARAAEVAHEAAEVAHEVGEAAEIVRSRRDHDHRKAVAIGVAVGVGVAVGAAAYVWWRSQHRDEQHALLEPEPLRPDESPASTEGPSPTPPETPVDAPPPDEETLANAVTTPGPPAVASSSDEATAAGSGAHAGSRGASEPRRGPASARLARRRCPAPRPWCRRWRGRGCPRGRRCLRCCGRGTATRAAMTATGGRCYARWCTHSSARPHRLGDQDATLSRWKQRFESAWGYQPGSRRLPGER